MRGMAKRSASAAGSVAGVAGIAASGRGRGAEIRRRGQTGFQAEPQREPACESDGEQRADRLAGSRPRRARPGSQADSQMGRSQHRSFAADAGELPGSGSGA